LPPTRRQRRSCRPIAAAIPSRNDLDRCCALAEKQHRAKQRVDARADNEFLCQRAPHHPLDGETGEAGLGQLPNAPIEIGCDCSRTGVPEKQPNKKIPALVDAAADCGRTRSADAAWRRTLFQVAWIALRRRYPFHLLKNPAWTLLAIANTAPLVAKRWSGPRF